MTNFTDAQLLTLPEGTLLLDSVTGFAYRVGAAQEFPDFSDHSNGGWVKRPQITGHEKGAYGWGGSSTGYKADAFAELDLMIVWSPAATSHIATIVQQIEQLDSTHRTEVKEIQDALDLVPLIG